MEEWLNNLWQKFKPHKLGRVILFFIVTVGVLSFFAMVSDIGFSQEIQKYRYLVLLTAFLVALIYVIGWRITVLTKANNHLIKQMSDLNQEMDLIKNDSQQKNIASIYLKQTVLGLYQEIEQRRIFQVIKVQLFKESLFLTLKKNKGVDLVKGDEIRILDKSDGEVLGIFEITEIKSTEYLAQNSKYVSPIWMGHVHQQVESTAPPNSLAIHYAKEVNNNG